MPTQKLKTKTQKTRKHAQTCANTDTDPLKNSTTLTHTHTGKYARKPRKHTDLHLTRTQMSRASGGRWCRRFGSSSGPVERKGASLGLKRSYSHLLKSIFDFPLFLLQTCFFNFPLLVLKGIYHYWTYFRFFQGSYPNGRLPTSNQPG